jgi:hypothetical protein
LEISGPDLAALLEQFRIWWINAGTGGICLAGLVAVSCILAWRSPELLRVYFDFRKAKLDHERLNAVLQRKIAAELEKRNEARRR